MNVIMCCHTTYQGERLRPGQKTSVDEAVAARWIRMKIAKEDAAPDHKPLDKMKTEELEAFAAEKGYDITGAKTNAERVDLINAAIAGGNE